MNCPLCGASCHDIVAVGLHLQLYHAELMVANGTANETVTSASSVESNSPSTSNEASPPQGSSSSEVIAVPRSKSYTWKDQLNEALKEFNSFALRTLNHFPPNTTIEDRNRYLESNDESMNIRALVPSNFLTCGTLSKHVKTLMTPTERASYNELKNNHGKSEIICRMHARKTILPPKFEVVTDELVDSYVKFNNSTKSKISDIVRDKVKADLFVYARKMSGGKWMGVLDSLPNCPKSSKVRQLVLQNPAFRQELDFAFRTEFYKSSHGEYQRRDLSNAMLEASRVIVHNTGGNSFFDSMASDYVDQVKQSVLKKEKDAGSTPTPAPAPAPTFPRLNIRSHHKFQSQQLVIQELLLESL